MLAEIAPIGTAQRTETRLGQRPTLAEIEALLEYALAAVDDMELTEVGIGVERALRALRTIEPPKCPPGRNEI